MYQFIYWLRILAAVLITNAHYEEVYPISIIANGGLLGDVIFFAVSGFCLFPVRQKFRTWYGKRLARIYPPILIAVSVFLLLRFYFASDIVSLVRVLIYPTYYHFVSSILILYIPIYFVLKQMQKQPEQGNRWLAGSGLLLTVSFFLVYYTVYDRSVYQIDNVQKPMIRFLFFAAMLIGVYFRINAEKYVVKGGTGWWISAVGLFVAYFVSKLLFARGTLPTQLQWINQVILLLLLAVIFRCVMGLENVLCELPARVRRASIFLAGMTLEIYLVQYPLIHRLNVGPFPVNFFVVSGGIFLSALCLHGVSNGVMYAIRKFRKGGVKQI